jgi:transcriptional regulator with XRE-family HTH domain
MEIDYVLIGKRIAKRRDVLDITQAELAEKANLSATYTGNVERGAKCSIETLMKICSALDVTPDYLLLGVDKMYRTDTLDEIRDLIYRCEPKL